MKILIVSNNYHPLATPRAFRWTAVAEHWARQGHQVDVVCGWVPGAARTETRAGVRVWRVGGVGEALRSRLRRTDGALSAPLRPAGGRGAAGGGRSRVSVSAAARWVHDRTWRQLYWPDFACLWYRPALMAASRLLERHGHDALVTVSHPFTGHLVGRRLKRRFPAVRWLVDIGDPFAFETGTPPNNESLYRGLNYRAERGVLGEADEVSVTTAGTAERYVQAFPETAGRIHVVPPIVTVPEGAGGPFFEGRADALRLVFTGSLYRRLRSPEPLLRLFAHLLGTGVGERLELHFLGAVNGCEDLFQPYGEHLGRRIFLHGAVPREAAFRAMRQADVLVNLGNETGYQLPSKVVEYVACARPVLHLGAGRGDASTEFFAAYPAALHLPVAEVDDPAAVARVACFLERLPPVDPAAAARLLAPYRVGSVAAQYARLLGAEPAVARSVPALEGVGAHE
jgi:glycosyltransferase involved in cell wall biosynthesis